MDENLSSEIRKHGLNDFIIVSEIYARTQLEKLSISPTGFSISWLKHL